MRINVLKTAVVIATVTILSKVLGFFREVLIAHKFGSSIESDCYFVALTVGTVIITIIGKGLNTALIPMLAKADADGQEPKSLSYFNNIINCLLVLTSLCAIAGWYFAPVVIRLFANGFSEAQHLLTVRLFRISLPTIVFLMTTYAFKGFLQHKRAFFVPASNGIPFNIILITYLALSGASIETLMVVTTTAVFVRLLYQMPAALKAGFRFSPGLNFNDKYLKKTIAIGAPAVLGSVVQQINVIVDKALASALVAGSISALSYASKLSHMILDVLVTSVLMVVYPELAKECTNDNMESLGQHIRTYFNMLPVLLLPITVGIILLASPIVQLIFEHGAFNSVATSMTASAFALYSLGLLGQGYRAFLVKVFYSMHDSKTPMVNAIFIVGINIMLNLILIRFMEHAGLALATGISSIVAAALLTLSLRRKLNNIDVALWFKSFPKVAVASCLMGLFIYGYKGVGLICYRSILTQVLSLTICGVAAVVVYVASCHVLNVSEVREPLQKVVSRIREKRLSE